VTTLTRYASTALLLHLTATLVLFVSMLQLLDILGSADDIFERHGAGVLPLLYHMLLRLPELSMAALPFSVLVAALLVLAKFANNNEVLALKAAGVSYYGLLAAFLPAAILVAVAYFLLTDQLAPAASRALSAWNVEASGGPKDPVVQPSGAANWLRDGQTRVRVGAIAREGQRLLDVTLFICDERGNLIQRVRAPEARYEDGAWTLADAEILDIDAQPGGDTVKVFNWVWETSLSPGQFVDMTAPAPTLGVAELLRFVESPEQGNRPVNVYETWMHKRLATPFTVFLMILLSAPVAQRFQRQRSIAMELSIGMGLGFLFFVTDGLLLALGEAGALPPAVAAWAPMLLFASLGATTLVRMEGH
jgi:lipopolysaccharide export system permease protein